jgi:hypothetical protein
VILETKFRTTGKIILLYILMFMINISINIKTLCKYEIYGCLYAASGYHSNGLLKSFVSVSHVNSVRTDNILIRICEV